jgi:hypothetical protein
VNFAAMWLHIFVFFKAYNAQLFDQGIGAKIIFKEVVKFLNLVRFVLTKCEVVGYYERKLVFLI